MCVGKDDTDAVISRDRSITDWRDSLLLSTTDHHTTLSMVQLREPGVPPVVTHYDCYCSAGEMNQELRAALIFLLEAFGHDMLHHESISADVPRQIDNTNCAPLGCIALVQQFTGCRFLRV